jgi:hypothetical protein
LISQIIFEMEGYRQVDSQEVEEAPSFWPRQSQQQKYREGMAGSKLDDAFFGGMAAIVGMALWKSGLVFL